MSSAGVPDTVVSLSELTDAIDRSVSFLRRGRSPDGLWRDFRTRAGPGSDWVTGFVAYALYQTLGESEVVTSALAAVIKRQASAGGWSYNITVPNDCDSTSWVLLALATCGALQSAPSQQACEYVRLHQDTASGGFSTYSAADGIAAFIGAPRTRSARGWLSPHACVSGVALQALLAAGEPQKSDLVRRTVAYLLNERGRDGLWRPYWWTGYAYATYHALRALRAAGVSDQTLDLDVFAGLLKTQHRDGSWSSSIHGPGEPFETALSLLVLVNCVGARSRESATVAARWLLKQETVSGNWSSVPIMRIPPPMVELPDVLNTWAVDQLGTGVVIRDEGRLFTTATVTWALAAYRKVFSDAA